jgi:cephalosporin hydroxylase
VAARDLRSAGRKASTRRSALRKRASARAVDAYWDRVGPVAGRYFARYFDHKESWQTTRWLGVQLFKLPNDLWVYQEILFEKRPDLIIELGTNHGGTTSYLAAICDLIEAGRIVTVDLHEREGRPPHPRVTYLNGNSVGPEVLAQIAEAVRPEDTVMAILDSNHAQSHVAKELSRYAPLVTPDQYLIVEDTDLNGHPVREDFGPGPMEAVDEP